MTSNFPLFHYIHLYVLDICANVVYGALHIQYAVLTTQKEANGLVAICHDAHSERASLPSAVRQRGNAPFPCKFYAKCCWCQRVSSDGNIGS